MKNVNLADAKARLSELVAEAEAGSPIVILRHGKPVAELRAPQRVRKPVDIAYLRSLSSILPEADEPAAIAIRKMRDTDRY